MRVRQLLFAVLLLSLGVLARPATAQPLIASQSTERSHVRVYGVNPDGRETRARWYVGKLVQVSDESIVVDTEFSGFGVVAIPRETAQRFDVRYREPQRLPGAVLGLALGAGVGVAWAGYNAEKRSSSRRFEIRLQDNPGFMGGAVGLVGAIVGMQLFSGEKWRSVQRNEPTYRVAPLLGSQPGIALAGTF